jgi:response regulator RpfG family c-di-GMP phosphodiesterase
VTLPSGELSPVRLRVLCVDDDANVATLLSRLLSANYEVVAANSAPTALGQFTGGPPFAVVISDYRMPGTDGVTLLGQIRELAPDTARILLTGDGALDTAVAAVNRGHIFRFLSKPCTPDVLRAAVSAAADQYRLVTAERVLLEQTLHGSVRALIDVLALAQPQAFGRATRVRRHVADLADRVQERNVWPIEIAAMLSQVGCAALSAATLDRYLGGGDTTMEEQGIIAALPATAERLIADIPRLEAVREILRCQDTRYDRRADVPPRKSGPAGDDIPRGARMLKIALDFDLLENRGLPLADVLNTMRSRVGWYDEKLLAAFGDLRGADLAGPRMKQMRLSQVHVGMVFAADVRGENGMLLVARGQEVGVSLVDRIRYQWQDFAGKCAVSMLIESLGR